MSDAAVAPSGGTGRGPMIVAIGWVFTMISVLAVLLLVNARRKNKIGLAWDVWFMVAALIMRLFVQIVVTLMLQYGFGKYDVDLTPDDLIMLLKLTWIGVPPAFMCSLFARFAITIVLNRLFGVHRWFRWLLNSLAGLLTAVSIAAIVIIFAQVSPTKALWDIYVVPTRQWDPRVFLYAGYLINSIYTFSDLAYVLFPVMIIWRLQMPVRRRIGLMLLMTLSLFTMSMSILKTIWIAAAAHTTQQTKNAQYNESLNVLFMTLEACFVIIIGCIPSLRGFVNLNSVRHSFVRLWSSTSSRMSSNLSEKSTDGGLSSSTSDMNNIEYRKSGGLDLRKDSHHASVTTCHGSGSENDEIEIENDQIVRTAEWTVTYAKNEETPKLNV